MVSSCLADLRGAVVVVGVRWFPWFHTLPAEAMATLALHTTDKGEKQTMTPLLPTTLPCTVDELLPVKVYDSQQCS